MGVMTKQKVFVKVPKKIKTKIWLKTTVIQSGDFIEADENEMNEDDVVSLESNQSRETTLSIIDHSSPIPSFSNSNRRSMLELEILLYKIYLNHMNGFKVPIDQHDFFIWLKSALKVSIYDDDLCLNAWKRWSLFLTLEEEGEDFEQFMIRIRNNFEAELGKNDIEETNSINSTNLSTSTEFIGDDYDALGILLRKLYLFEQEGYIVPDCEEKFINWLITSCNGKT
uniref:Uncharacterized protein n=1 Tax=Acrobeloides nanus TaxID=290746 RepID=A0A914CRU5_9BILA